MATYSSVIVWEILWTEKPDGLQSLASQRTQLRDGTHAQKQGAGCAHLEGDGVRKRRVELGTQGGGEGVCVYSFPEYFPI